MIFQLNTYFHLYKVFILKAHSELDGSQAIQDRPKNRL